MKEITIKPVESVEDIDKFIEFNYQLYKGNPYYIPDLKIDLFDTFDKNKNPGMDFSQMQLFLAFNNEGKIIGRVAAIINNRANEIWNSKNVRFGWIDFIEDIDVCKALLDTVEKWGKERGMEKIVGPLGVTDLDKEGMLIEGFDKLSTMNTIYNYPYYPLFMEQLGYEKETDWVELKLKVPQEIPAKFARISEISLKRSKLHVKKLKKTKEIKEGGYGQKIFDLINEAYAPLYGYSKMTQKQIDLYVNKFLPLIDLRMITLIEEDETNDLVCVGLSMPSLAKALQKSGGKLTPFGWFHLLKSLKLKHEEGVELLLIAVRPDYQGRGVAALLFSDLIPIFQDMGFKWAETNCILEDNIKNLSLWNNLDPEIPKKRRCWKKDI